MEAPLQFLAYEELVEVVTRAVAKLKLDRPAKKQDACAKSKLDKQLLRARTQPPLWGLPFFPDPHTKVSRSCNYPDSARLFSSNSATYSNIVGLNEQCYQAMPRIEQMLASYLSHVSASPLNASRLPTRPLKAT